MAEGSEVKENVKLWFKAVDAQTSGRHRDALEAYRQTDGKSARILYNMACAYVCLNKPVEAIECLNKAVAIDVNLAIAFFQRGCLNLKLDSLKAAIYDFEMTKLILRGNTFINYKPLGMLYKLNSCEILLNLALAYYLDNDVIEAEHVLLEAFHDSEEYCPYRKQVNDATAALKAGHRLTYQPYSVPADRLFTPPKSITDNLESKQRPSGVSKVVFTYNEDDNSPSFCGSTRIEKRLREIQEQKHRALKRNRSLNDLNFLTPPARSMSCRKRSFSVGNISEVSPNTTGVRFKKASFKKSFKKIGKMCRNLHTKSDSVIVKPKRTFLKSKSAGCVSDKPAGLENTDAATSATERTKSATTAKSSSELGGKLIQSLSESTRLRQRPSRKIRLTRMVKSTSDIGKSKVVLPLDPKPKSQSSSSLVKKLIPGKNKLSGKKKHKQTQDFPTLMMEGFQSVNSLLTVIADTAIEEQTDKLDVDYPDGINVGDKDVINEPLIKDRQDKTASSLSQAFGDRTTVVRYALTIACDVATAVITPVSKEKDFKNNFQHSKRLSSKGVFLKRSQMADNSCTKPKEKAVSAGPPKDLASSLFATCQMFSAFAHVDFTKDMPVSDKFWQPECPENNVRLESSAERTEEIDNLDHNYVNVVDYLVKLKKTKTSPLTNGPSTSSDVHAHAANKGIKISTIDTKRDRNEAHSKETNYLNVGNDILNKSRAGQIGVDKEMRCKKNNMDKCKSQVKPLQKDLIDLDDDGYVPMSRTKKRIPPSYPPPPLRINFNKKKKHGHDTSKSLHSLLGQTVNLAAAFAGLQIHTDNETSTKEKEPEQNESTHSAYNSIDYWEIPDEKKTTVTDENLNVIGEENNDVSYENMKSFISDVSYENVFRDKRNSDSDSIHDYVNVNQFGLPGQASVSTRL